MDLGSISKIIPLIGLADAVNITDSPNCKLNYQVFLLHQRLKGLDVILQLTGRDRNRLPLSLK